MGHGYKSGGFSDYVTSKGSPAAANINRQWKKHSAKTFAAEKKPRAMLG